MTDEQTATHTPGPWEWTPDLGNATHAHNQWLCGQNAGVLLHGGPWPISDANADLVAAAPDLLAACEAGVFYAGGPMRDETDEGRRKRLRACMQIKAAIAKAKGTP